MERADSRFHIKWSDYVVWTVGVSVFLNSATGTKLMHYSVLSKIHKNNRALPAQMLFEVLLGIFKFIVMGMFTTYILYEKTKQIVLINNYCQYSCVDKTM